MRQLTPVTATFESTEASRVLTPSWDGIPVVEIKPKGIFSPIVGLIQRQAAFVIVFSVLVAHIVIGWTAYRLFHLLTPDVRRAFLASTDVKWTLVMGAAWVFALLTLASMLVLKLINSHVTSPLSDLARVAESVARGDLTAQFVPSTSVTEVGRLSRATASMMTALKRLATAMRASARDATTISSQITAATENMATAAQQTAATSGALSQEAREMARTIQEIAADAAKLEEVSSSLRGRAQEGLRRERRLRSLAQENRARLDDSSRALEMLTYDAGASAESIEEIATAVYEIRSFLSLVQ
jgi:methyl-accepting chemotaxis protein